MRSGKKRQRTKTEQGSGKDGCEVIINLIAMGA
jgi:hypothetical protein